MMNKNATTALILMSLACTNVMGGTMTNDTEAIKVDSTELASFNNIMDVISQIPGIYLTDDGINVVGRGIADVYINDRRLTELTELWHIPASKVEKIQIEKNPGAQYDKSVSSVIIIRMKEVTDNGFKLDNKLRFDYSNLLSTNNELTLGWKHDKLDIGAFVGWNQVRNTAFEKDYHIDYKEKAATGGNLDEYDIKSHSQQLTVKGNIGYDITPLHRIEASYTFQRAPRNYDQEDEITSHTFKPVNGGIDFGNPSSSTVTPGHYTTNPMTRHIVNAEYRGYIDKWTLLAGTNLTFEDKSTNKSSVNDTPTQFKRKETITRSYAKATLPVGNGDFNTGVEFNSDNMDVTYNANNPNPNVGKWFDTHTDNSDISTAAFINLSQKFGIWSFSGGMRYEGTYFTYKPFEDDGLMLYLDKYMSQYHDFIDTDKYIYARLWLDRKFTKENHNIYPTLSINAQLGESTLKLTHSLSYKKAYLAMSRITLSDLSNDVIQERLLNNETITTTELEWKWKWLSATLTHDSHENPVFGTTSSLKMFNGDAYDDINLNITASPTIGPWHPSISMNLYKQWLELDCSKPDKLKKPILYLEWNNTLNLPHNWLFLVNADWHSRGAKGNTYNYSTNLNMNASIQKTFPKQNLSVTLQVDNIFRNSYDDITIYVNDATASDGYAIRNSRTASLTLKYQL